MTTTEITLVLFGLVVMILLGLSGWFYYRRQTLKQRFGPEYDRLVSEQDSTHAAERELRERERRHAELRLNELTPETRQWYAEQWQEIQSRFVESPREALGSADDLVTRLVSDRGYPVRDYKEQVSLLSVKHSRTIEDYRLAHDIAQRQQAGGEGNETDTEEQRQAIVHYRALVADLLGDDPVHPTATDGTAGRSSHDVRK